MRTLTVEQLEPRCTPAATMIDFEEGWLYVWGSPRRDVIVVAEAGDRVLVFDGDGDPADFARAEVAGVVVFGGRGNDRLIVAGSVVAHLHGDAGRDTLVGGDAADLIDGGAGNDVILGGAGDDWLFGDYGNDWLLGGDGDDYLWGCEGRDRLVGGGGADKFAWDGGGNVVVDFASLFGDSRMGPEWDFAEII